MVHHIIPAIDVARARYVARAGNHGEGHAQYKAVSKARLQSLYLETDASPDKDMLRHYWSQFTRRPPSRLPAFGLAQSDSDLARHVAAAKRAIVRDCGGAADCEWMHAQDGGVEGGAGARAGVKRRSAAGDRVRGGRPARKAGEESAMARAEKEAVNRVLSEEVKMNGQQQPAGKQMRSEESALLWEVKALMAQKQLVQQQVRSRVKLSMEI